MGLAGSWGVRRRVPAGARFLAKEAVRSRGAVEDRPMELAAAVVPCPGEGVGLSWAEGAAAPTWLGPGLLLLPLLTGCPVLLVCVCVCLRWVLIQRTW